MKNILYIGTTIILLTVILLLSLQLTKSPKIDLPEEYELITPNTPIEGSYKDGVLIIKFKH